MSVLDSLFGTDGGGDFWGMVAKNAIPALFTSAAVGPDHTSDNLAAMRPYYDQMARQAQEQRALALAAITRAQAGADQMQTPVDAAGKAAADFDIQQNNRVQQTQQQLAANGVRPDSGAYTGALAAINGAGSSAGKVNAMNSASTGAASAKQGALSAIPSLYAGLPGSSEMATAGAGMINLNGLDAAAYDRKVRNVMTAFKGDTPMVAAKNGSGVVNYYYGSGGSGDSGPVASNNSTNMDNWNGAGAEPYANAGAGGYT